MNLSLKIALVARGVPSYITAKEVGISPNKLSRFVMGISCPNEQEKKVLSKILDKTVRELFPEGKLGETRNAP